MKLLTLTTLTLLYLSLGAWLVEGQTARQQRDCHTSPGFRSQLASVLTWPLALPTAAARAALGSLMPQSCQEEER